MRGVVELEIEKGNRIYLNTYTVISSVFIEDNLLIRFLSFFSFFLSFFSTLFYISFFFDGKVNRLKAKRFGKRCDMRNEGIIGAFTGRYENFNMRSFLQAIFFFKYSFLEFFYFSRLPDPSPLDLISAAFISDHSCYLLSRRYIHIQYEIAATF